MNGFLVIPGTYRSHFTIKNDIFPKRLLTRNHPQDEKRQGSWANEISVKVWRCLGEKEIVEWRVSTPTLLYSWENERETFKAQQL